jgi:hypothetical protein
MTVSMTTRAAAASSLSRADWRVAMGAPALYLLLLVGLAQALALLLLAAAAVARCGAQSMLVYGSLALLLAQLGAGLLTFRWLRQRSAQTRLGGASGFGPVHNARGWLLAGETGGLLLALGAAGLAWLLPHPASAPPVMASLLITLPALPLASTLISVLLAPLFEEGVFRGALLGALAPALGPLGAGIASTALFTALHLPEQAGYGWGLLPIAALGGFAAWLRVRSGSLWPGIVAHVCFNALVGFGALH